jgi:uncharacterized protein YjdB
MWIYNGVSISGTIVTVGSGKDYATIAAAISGTTGNLLILLDEGSFDALSLSGVTGRDIYIKGVGEDTILYTASNPAVYCHAVDDVNVIIESTKLTTGSANHGIYSNLSSAGVLSITLSKCVLDFTGLGYHSWVACESPLAQTTVKFKQCSINTLQSNANYIFAGWSLYSHAWDISDCEIDKCVIPYASGTKDTTGTLAVDDYVTAAASGYGEDYGDELIEVVSSISVAPATQSLSVGGKIQFQATGTLIDSRTVDLTERCSWSSSNTAVASIQALYGLAQALTEGTATITATFGALTDTSVITVTEAEDLKQIVLFSGLTLYRNAEYKSKRYRFPLTTLSCIKVIASQYPVKIDIIYPSIPITVTVSVTSERPQRIKPYLVDCCEVKFLTDSHITAIYLSSRMDEIPL